MEEILIEAVQMHPCLYDKSQQVYRNKLTKEKAWKSVASATDATVEQCQNRWRSLRDRYVKQVASGASVAECTGWRYMDSMSFLKRHVAPKRNRRKKLNMEEILIEAVQMHPCLYDKSQQVYRNKLTKEKAWKSVASATNATVEQCQNRWRSLRDRYVKQVASEKPKSRESVSKFTRWRYMDAMSFLKQHVVPGKTLSNMQSAASEEEHSFDFYDTYTPTDEVASTMTLNGDENFISEEEVTLRSGKRRNVDDVDETHKRFDPLCLIERETQSRNTDFLKVLDGYLLKHSEEDQDRLKIQILNLVYTTPK